MFLAAYCVVLSFFFVCGFSRDCCRIYHCQFSLCSMSYAFLPLSFLAHPGYVAFLVALFILVYPDAYYLHDTNYNATVNTLQCCISLPFSTLRRCGHRSPLFMGARLERVARANGVTIYGDRAQMKAKVVLYCRMASLGRLQVRVNCGSLLDWRT